MGVFDLLRLFSALFQEWMCSLQRDSASVLALLNIYLSEKKPFQDCLPYSQIGSLRRAKAEDRAMSNDARVMEIIGRLQHVVKTDLDLHLKESSADY